MIFEPPKLSDKLCGWHIDLRSHILFSPEGFENHSRPREFWLRTYQHEISHWARFQTSTIGLLLAFLQRAGTITAHNALSHLPPDTCLKILRETQTGIPVWSFNSEFNPKRAGDIFAVLGQSWLDIQYTYNLIFDSTRINNIIQPFPNEAIGGALSDAWRAAISFPGMHPHPGNEIADRIFSGRAQQVQRFGLQLTTRALWECASTLDELKRFNKMPEEDYNQIHRLVSYKLEDPTYGAPWQIANEICNGKTSIRMFQIIVYLATNPPLPFWDDTLVTLDWGEIYPPKRFVALYNYVSENQWLHEQVANYEEPANLNIAIKQILLGSGVRVAKPSPPTGLDFNSHPGLRQRFVGDINSVLRSALFLRGVLKDDWQRLIFPSIYDIRFSSHLDQATIEDVLKIQQAGKPFLMQFMDGLQGNQLFSERQNDFYCASAWAHNTLNSIINAEPYQDLSYLPDGMYAPDPFQRISDLVTRSEVLDW